MQRLRTIIDKKVVATKQKFYCEIYNLGISGDTTEDLLRRLEFEVKQRVKEDDDTIIIFAIGSNDCALVQSINDFWVAPKKFEENILKLKKLAQKYSKKIIFVGSTPVDESVSMPVFWNTDISYENENIRKYDAIIKSACAKNNAHFIEIFGNCIKSDYKKILEDGVHPNSRGHKLIFEEVMKLLCTLPEFQAFQS